MSTSTANPEAPNPDGSASGPAAPDLRLGQTDRTSGRSKDEITVVHVPGVPPVPAFLSADAARRPVDGGSDGTPTLESEVRRLQAALNTAAGNRPVQRFGRSEASSSRPARGRAAPGLLTAMLSRPGFAVAGMALASVMIAAGTGAFVFVMLPQTDDLELAELPPATALPSEPEAGANVSDAARQIPLLPVPPQAQPPQVQAPQAQPFPPPAVPLPPAAQPENRPAETPVEVAALPMTDDPPAAPEPSPMKEPSPPATPEPPAMTTQEPAPSAASELPATGATAALEPERPERAVIVAPVLTPSDVVTRESAPSASPPPPVLPEPPALAAPAHPEPSVLAAREPDSPGRPESQPEPLAANRIQPRAGVAVAPSRFGFTIADSGIRYLTGAELQKLPVDRLRIARNEIFARKGRYFKDEALRAYFSQFAWYQPRAWDVALSPVEAANVVLIQSIEDAASAASPTRGFSSPAAAEAEAGTRTAAMDPQRQYLTTEQLRGLSADQLLLVRNEIFARKGRYFKDPALRAYFEQFVWYRPHAWDVQLSPVERANVDLIQSYEQTMPAPGPAAMSWRAPPM